MKPLHELTGVEAAQAIAAHHHQRGAGDCLSRTDHGAEESVRREYLAPEAALAQARTWS